MLMLQAPNVKGQGLVEYAIIIALVAIVVFIALAAFGTTISNLFKTVASAMPY